MAHWENVPFDPWSSWWVENPWFVSLASGAFAGLTAEMVLFPLDCLKTRVQSGQSLSKLRSARMLYRGCGTAMAGSVPASAIFFSTYEFTKTQLGSPSEQMGCESLRDASTFVAAAVVGELSASLVRAPVDLIKQRLQAGHQSTFSIFMHFPTLLASFQATAMRDVMHSSLQYPLYEYLKFVVGRYYLRSAANCKTGLHNPRCGPLPVWLTATCGCVAGVVSATLTTPFDVLKTRLNLRPPPENADTYLRPAAGGASSSLSLVRQEASKIYVDGGASGFFRGASYRAAWMGLGGFVFLGSFEFAKDYLGGLAKPREESCRLVER